MKITSAERRIWREVTEDACITSSKEMGAWRDKGIM